MSAPLKKTRLFSLALACVWGAIAGCVGLNALVKSNQEQSHFKSIAPPPSTITISVMNIFPVAVVVTTVSALIGLLCFVFVSLDFIHLFRIQRNVRQYLVAQASILSFCWVWLLASHVPYTVFFATREAEVHAYIGTTELPKSVVEATAKSLGQTPIYHVKYYLRLLLAMPWATLLFTFIAIVVLFVAASRATAAVPAADSSEKTGSGTDVSDQQQLHNKTSV